MRGALAAVGGVFGIAEPGVVNEVAGVDDGGSLDLR